MAAIVVLVGLIAGGVAYAATRSEPADAGPLRPEPGLYAASYVHDEHLSPMFQAVAGATEEAIINSLFAAETVVGRDGNTREALPIERTLDLMHAWRSRTI